MANYQSIEEAILSGITNMTTHRNGSGNDDEVDTLQTNISWFYYNGVCVSNVYASGNSWIGFGVSSEQLKVNRRDAKMYYLYSETGKIGNYRFYKIRWIGYSAYNQSSDSYAQKYDVFVFDNGQIYLNFYDVPVSSVNGTNQLVCGSETVSYQISSGAACEYTFKASNVETGSGWTVQTGKPELVFDYVSHGEAVYEINGLTAITDYESSRIMWNANTPTGTSVSVYSSINNGVYIQCSNGQKLPGFVVGNSYSGSALHIKVVMETINSALTPDITSISVKIRNKNENKTLYLYFQPGCSRSIQNASGSITVVYSGGNLQGTGGPVSDFSLSFSPNGLENKAGRNANEHLTASTNFSVTLTHVTYTDSKSNDEHLSATPSFSAILTHIDDI